MQTTTPVYKNYQAKEMCVATMFDLDLPLNYTCDLLPHNSRHSKQHCLLYHVFVQPKQMD